MLVRQQIAHQGTEDIYLEAADPDARLLMVVAGAGGKVLYALQSKSGLSWEYGEATLADGAVISSRSPTASSDGATVVDFPLGSYLIQVWLPPPAK